MNNSTAAKERVPALSSAKQKPVPGL